MDDPESVARSAIQGAFESATDAARARERERCAKIADEHARLCIHGGPMTSMAEDHWGCVAAKEIALKIRNQQ